MIVAKKQRMYRRTTEEEGAQGVLGCLPMACPLIKLTVKFSTARKVKLCLAAI
jgi:hypothetical protein